MLLKRYDITVGAVAVLHVFNSGSVFPLPPPPVSIHAEFLPILTLTYCLSTLLSLQSLDEDCTLEEEDEGLIEEEDEIDQFNDDTFGAGAISESCLKHV